MVIRFLSIALAISLAFNLLQINIGESCRVKLSIQNRAVVESAKLYIENEKLRAEKVNNLSSKYKKDISVITSKKIQQIGNPLDTIIFEMRNNN